MPRNEDLKFIFNTFGEDNQMKKLAEEVSEYLQAYLKGEYHNAIAEMADIKVLVDQFYLESDSMHKEYCRKILRTKDRIKEDYYI